MALGSEQNHTKSVRLPEIHRLRGVAILMIVAAHCYQFFGWSLHPTVEAVFKDAFDNSSLIFMFVAGFLFQHTEEKRFAYKGYLLRKFINVFIPFVIAITPAILFALLRGSPAFAEAPVRDFSFAEKIIYLAIYPGETMNFALWFVPVIAVYYLAAPLLRALDQRQSYWMLAVLLPLSVLMHRPTYSKLHNLTLAVYFLSSYLLGMCFSRNWKRTVSWLTHGLVPLTVAFAIVFMGHLLLSDHHGKSTTQDPFETQGTEGWIDWMYVQKMLMAMVFLGVLHFFRDRSAKVLDYLAGASFTIFFYHLYFIYLVSWLTRFSVPEFRPDYFLLLFVFAVGGPCVIVLVARKLFPSWSRALVGASVESTASKKQPV